MLKSTLKRYWWVIPVSLVANGLLVCAVALFTMSVARLIWS